MHLHIPRVQLPFYILKFCQSQPTWWVICGTSRRGQPQCLACCFPCLIITESLTHLCRHPLRRWTVQVHQCVFGDQLSSVAIGSFQLWAGRSSFEVSHSPPSDSRGSSLIHRQLYYWKSKSKMLVTRQAAWFWLLWRNSIDCRRPN